VKTIGMSDEAPTPGGKGRQIEAEKICAFHVWTLSGLRSQATAVRTPIPERFHRSQLFFHAEGRPSFMKRRQRT